MRPPDLPADKEVDTTDRAFDRPDAEDDVATDRLHTNRADSDHAAAEHPEGDEPSDQELVQRARLRDPDAFALLATRHQHQIYRLALRMMGNEHEAEEVLQEAFLHAWEKLPAFRGEAAFSSWLYRIASNSALMRLRRRRRSPEVASEDPVRTALAAPSFAPDGAWVQPPRSDWSLRADDALHNRQLGGAIEDAVAALPEDYRVVFLLKDVEGLSNEEIARTLELSVPAVKSRLHRARLALREKLTGFFNER